MGCCLQPATAGNVITVTTTPSATACSGARARSDLACSDLACLDQRLASIAEFPAAGYAARFDASGRRLVIYRGLVARGYWSRVGGTLVWSSAAEQSSGIVTDSCSDAARRTMAMILTALVTKRRREGGA